MTDKRQELKDRLLRAFEICDKHIARIEEALCGLKSYFPLDEEKYLNLNSEAVMRLDQFIFRFSKLQDVIGAKIFRYVLAWLYEEEETMSMRDVLDRLERLGVIDSVESWVYMRELRNTIAHDYPLDTQEVVLSLNELVGSTETLKVIYERLEGFLLDILNGGWIGGRRSFRQKYIITKFFIYERYSACRRFRYAALSYYERGEQAIAAHFR